MRAMRAAPVIGFTLALLLGTSVAAEDPYYDAEALLPMREVTGSVVLDAPTSRGDFDVDGRVYQFRHVPVTGAPFVMTDPRLSGRFESDWNWDVYASGGAPVPAWGTMRIETPALFTYQRAGAGVVPSTIPEGAWFGEFTGIRREDGQPFQVRAFLMGEGAYEGLCATLDIEAGRTAWLADGVIHPVDMAG